MSTESTIDLTIFNHHSSPPIDINHDYQSCISIKRLLVSLKYYNQLKIENNSNNQEVFTNFMDEVYKHQVFDDYYHLIKFHQSQLEAILDLALNQYGIPKCNVSECDFANRHFRTNKDKEAIINNNNSTTNNKSRLQLYIETMDSLHFYILHMHQFGYRVSLNSSKTNSDEKQSSENSDDTYFDAKFSKIFNVIKESKETTADFTRAEGTKYNISAPDASTENMKQSIDANSKQEHVNTFLDFVYSHLSTVDNLSASILKQVIIAYGYDTESVNMDLQFYADDGISNISEEMQSEEIMNEMTEIFEESKSMYSLGILPLIMKP